MPLCPQITITPVTVTTSGMTTASVIAANAPATTEQLTETTVLIDGKTKAYYQATMPSSGMTEGDIWFDTDDGYKLYYYTGSAWTSVQDTSIAAAQSAATAAQTTADGKNKVYRQGTSPGTTGNAVGDTWFNTSADNAISRWDGTSWVATSLGNNALASISASKLTAGTIDASVITVSNLDAGNISTGTLAAARIASNSIDASKIVAGSITATQISSSYVYAGTIAAGSITAGTLSATVALNAVSGTIAGFTLTSSTITNGSTMTLYNNGDFYTGGVVSSGGGFYSTNACFLGSTLNVTGALTTSSSITTDGAATFANSGGTATSFRVLSTGMVRSLYTYGNQVTTSTRAVIQDNAGNFGNSTSTRRNKHQIESYKIDSNALLQLDLKTFKYKPNLDDDQTTQYGFIAEEAQELGLNELIQLDKDGIPDYFAYEKLSIFLLQLIQEQDARIQALEGK